MTYDRVHFQVVLFGGADAAGNVLGDTWTWDGTTWTQAAVTGPSARADAALTFDATRAKTVLFGGTTTGTAAGANAETWIWNGDSGNWAAAGTTIPPARSGHALVYDAARTETVMFGGID